MSGEGSTPSSSDNGSSLSAKLKDAADAVKQGVNAIPVSRGVEAMEGALDRLGEKWYPALRTTTFETQCMDLSMEEAQVLVDYYDDVKHSGHKVMGTGREAVLERLAQRIQAAMDDMGSHDGAFVRLSTRSPKDVALRSQRMKDILAAELAAAGVEDTRDQANDVATTICLIRAMSRALMSRSGEEAVHMLRSSERTYQDCFRRLLSCDEDTWAMQVIIRKWEPILPELEFRAFVNNGQMTALTQYYRACYAPEIGAHADDMCTRIREFWEAEVAPHMEAMQVTSYSVDFAVMPERVWMIEINHFGPTASPALFDWKVDKDVMYNGPFEFRALRQPVANVRSQMARALADLVHWPPPPQVPDEADAGDEPNDEKKCCIA